MLRGLPRPAPKERNGRMNDAERFARDGYVVFDRIFGPPFIDELRVEYSASSRTSRPRPIASPSATAAFKCRYG